MSKPKEIIQLMIQTSLVARLYHWYPTKPSAAGSYAEHKALGSLYNYLNEEIDELVEAIQGEEGLLEITIPETRASEIDPIQAIDILCEQIKKCECEEWIKNKLQEIEFALYQYKYKLTILK
jgi:hypothetical protein